MRSYAVIPAILLLGLLATKGYAVLDRWVDRRVGRRLNDAALSDASVAWAENEARR